METLIHNAKNGSEEAFHSLYDVLADRVFLFVRSRTNKRDDALDIIQDVFLDFWRDINKFEYVSDSKLCAFLYTIAQRKVAIYYKEKQYEKSSVSVKDIEDFLPNGESEETKLDIFDIKRSLEQVDQKDREIIELRYFSGLAFSDIADLTGETQSALKVRNHRALEKIRTILHIHTT